MQPLVLGPDSADLTIKTDVAGRASRFGHRLTLTLNDWSATIEFAGDTAESVNVSVQIAGFNISKGEGGVTPLSDIDRSVIRRTTLKSLDVDGHPEARFTTETTEQTGFGYALAGLLTIKGESQPVEIPVSLTEGEHSWQVSAEVEVRQTDFGVQPYSAILGTLKVRDEVTIHLTAEVPFPQG